MKLPLAIFLFCTSIIAFAHTKSDTIKYYIKIGLNASSYKGDLQSKYGESHAGLHLGLQFNRKKRFNGSLDLTIGNVTGQNPTYSYPQSKNNAVPNSFFKSNYVIVTYALHLNLIKRTHLQASVHAGFGIIRFQPKDQDQIKLIDQSNTRNSNENYSNVAFTFPIGMCVLYKIKNSLAFGVDMTWQKLTTDYLDNISQLSYSSKKDKMFQANLMLLIPLKD